ncbi:MAG: GHKL domain-containing protein [Candidatus Fimadaptatus sp.]|jgi:hypothetical protein
MADVLRPILEMAVVLPGILLACLPVRSYSKRSFSRQLCWMLPLLAGLAIGGGLICYYTDTFALPMLIIVALCAAMIYASAFSVSVWKSLSIVMSICSVFAYINGLSIALDAAIEAGRATSGNGYWFCLEAGIAYNAMCWLFVAVAAYPASHVVRRMVEDESFAQTWYVFWILPTVFATSACFMVPRYQSTLYVGRVLQCYIVFNIIMIFTIIAFNVIFLVMANSLNSTAKLQLRNHFLSMQRDRYESLRTAIEEARQARHDTRHLFNQLYAFMDAGEWDKAKEYISRAVDRIPVTDINACENRAADSVISHYCALAKREGIPFNAEVDLPQSVPVGEMDMCLILSNLLENAFEASLRTDSGRRYISIQAYMHASRLMLIKVENAFDGDISEDGGMFISTKRGEAGLGIQSIRRIAEKANGASAFSHQDGVFTAKVMLRG